MRRGVWLVDGGGGARVGDFFFILLFFFGWGEEVLD